jgi:hypothetical protein
MFLDSNKAIYGRFKAPANPVDTPRSLKSLKIGFDLSMIVLTKVIFAPFGFVLALVRVRVPLGIMHWHLKLKLEIETSDVILSIEL